MKYHFQVISETRDEFNPVISADDTYGAYHTLIEVCKNNDIIPTRIVLVQFVEDEEVIPCIIEDEPQSYWHKF